MDDLTVLSAQQPARIANLFESTVPKHAVSTAALGRGRLRTLEHYVTLRTETITEAARTAALESLRTGGGALLDDAGVPEEVRIDAWLWKKYPTNHPASGD